MKNFTYSISLIVLFTILTGAQTNWKKYEGNPVLTPGSTPWDIDGVHSGSVLFDGTTYRMWYAGDDGSFVLNIGIATSSDGITWNKYSGNPVLSPGELGAFDMGMVATPSVIFDEGIYKMWYTGAEPTTLQYWRIGYAESTDSGKTWTKHPNSVLDLGSSGEWDDYHVGYPSVIKDGSIYKMWYHGGRAYESGSIGYATSTDGINWTKYNNPATVNTPYAESDPVLTGFLGDWDEKVVWECNVILNNSAYEMWYVAQGNLPGLHQEMGYATSADGINWTKYNDPSTTNQPFIESDPIIRTGANGQFDDTYLLYPYVMLTNDQVYKMWYTGCCTPSWKVGYATDSSNVTSVIGQNSLLPVKFSLSQNYPNPFNPKTSIEYRVASSEYLTLKVYDLLGREVANLVDEFKPAGSYQVEWNASNMPSGIYVYQLKTENFTSMKKMILLK